jgi:hypothetical protein
MRKGFISLSGAIDGYMASHREANKLSGVGATTLGCRPHVISAVRVRSATATKDLTIRKHSSSSAPWIGEPKTPGISRFTGRDFFSSFEATNRAGS